MRELGHNQEEWEGIGGVGSKRFARIVRNELLGVAMICRDQQASPGSQRCFYDTANARINGFDCLDCSFDHACVTDHIGVGVVHNHQVVLSTANVLHGGIGDASRAHLG